MPYVSTRTVRTIKYTGGGVPEVTTTTTTIDNGDKKTITVHGNDSGGMQIGSTKFQTPRSTVIKPAVIGDGRSIPIRPTGSHAGDAVPEGRGGATVGLSQDYNNVKNSLRGKLYEDPDFPASDESIYYSQRPPRRIEWKRPHEICPSPEFISEGASRFDVRQGELGDCWLLAAVACLSLHSELFNQVVPSDQNFSKSNYCGMFRFRFWRFGAWKEVLVDDRLPTYNNKLVYMNSTDSNEFWSALLEKAYAKLSGSYESLKGGSTSEALEDFTGGVTEFFDLKKEIPKNLFDIMIKGFSRCSLMGCSIEPDPRKTEARLPNGLIMGHAYSITDVKMVNINIPGKSGKIQLIRIRNPWGNEAEWKGSWSDKSPEWNYISQADRNTMGLTFDDDGEFWMSYQDFIKNFEKMEICHLGPQSLEVDQLSGKKKSRWEMCIENGEWKKRLNAGGCRNYLETFWTNPQFRVKVVDPDEDDDDNLGTIIVGLMQKDMRKRRKEGVEFYTIGYAIYQLKDENQGPLDVTFFKYNGSIAKAPSFINIREVCGRHKLPPGTYVIVPSTFEPNQEASFLMRIFSEKPNESGELDEQTAMIPTENNPVVSKTVTSAPEKVVSTADDAQIAALRQSFNQIAGQDLEIDAYELQDILNTAFKKGPDSKYFKFDGFSIETSKSMVAMMDYDQSGKLGFDEFKVLWTDLRLWKEAFKKFDQDKSGNFNSYELRLCLNSVGFRLSNKILNSLVMRFANKEGLVLFDDYILCCVRLKTIFETYKSQPHDSKDRALFDQDTFIQCIMYV